VTTKRLNNIANVQIAAQTEIFLQHWKEWFGGLSISYPIGRFSFSQCARVTSPLNPGPR